MPEKCAQITAASCRQPKIHLCEDMMKRHISLAFVCMFFLVAAGTGFGQAACNFNIAGDWEATAPNHSGTNLYRFTPEGIVTVFSSAGKGEESQELGRAKY